jgi:hypothetical protein
MNKQGKHQKVYRTIQVEASTYDMVKYFAKAQGKTMLQTLKELFHFITLEGYQYQFGSLNVKYVHEESENTITLLFDGNSNFTQGRCSDRELTAMINDKKVGL